MSALVTTQLSSTMSCMFDLFLETKEIDLAKLAAFWSLRKALNTSRSVSNIARSFANVLKILSVTGGADQFMWLQKAALQQLIRTLFVDELDLEGLTNVVRMYQGIMMCQWVVERKLNNFLIIFDSHNRITRNDIRNAVKLGELTTNLCSRIQQKSFLIEVISFNFNFESLIFFSDCSAAVLAADSRGKISSSRIASAKIFRRDGVDEWCKRAGLVWRFESNAWINFK